RVHRGVPQQLGAVEGKQYRHWTGCDIGKERFSSLVEALDRSGWRLRAVVELGNDLAPIHRRGHDLRLAHVLCCRPCDAKSHDQRGKTADAQRRSPGKMMATRGNCVESIAAPNRAAKIKL